MGSVPYVQGATLRVWAPNADSVAVAGSFNEWSTQAHSLIPEGGGFWSADVDGANAGDEYKSVTSHQATELRPGRPDPSPRARGGWLAPRSSTTRTMTGAPN